MKYGQQNLLQRRAFQRNVIFLKRMGRLKLRETARTLSMGNVCRRAPRWDNNAVKK